MTLSFQNIHYSTKSYRIGSSRTVGENDGVSKDTIESTVETVPAGSIQWPRVLWLFNTQVDYINKFFMTTYIRSKQSYT